VTVLAIIQRSSDYLTRKGVESARLQIELLLAHVLQMPRLQLYLNFERVLTEPELQTLRELVRRRAQREPLQHIVGSTSFCGLEIAVSRDVLVPRPETEMLAERGWKFLQGLATSSPLALDFGTGSGCLAIALAAKCARAQVHAVDISEAALTVARANAARHQVAQRVWFHQGDGFHAVPGGLRFDLVIANPPYIATSELALLQPEVRDFDPRTALDGGLDGLDFYRRLSLETAPFLADGGRLLLEFGDGQEQPLAGIFEKQKWVVESVEPDYTGRPRILVAHC
jgi:release factor glutamine methyltransferase